MPGARSAIRLICGYIANVDVGSTAVAIVAAAKDQPLIADITMFIEYLNSNPVFYISAVVGLIVSITLHELAHGWAAIYKGDDTPRVLGHMTPDPVTHMGPIGLIAVCLCGIGWGAMPINPSRMKGRHAHAFVAFAGPCMNLLLALVGLTALALWARAVAPDELSTFQANLREALWYFGYINIGLFLFNLIPVPPLDGSRILADFNRGYDRWLRDNEHAQGFMFMGLLIIVLGMGRTEYGLFSISAKIAEQYLSLWA